MPYSQESNSTNETVADKGNASAFQYSVNEETDNVDVSVDRGPISIDILEIFVPPGIGNAVKLVWGRQLDKLNLNITYNVYYGVDGEKLSRKYFHFRY